MLLRLLLGLSVVAAAPAAADSVQKAADAVFELRFSLGAIQGTGHVFRIVVGCDKARLEQMSKALPKKATRVVDYDFTLVLNTRDRARARIDGGDLDPAVQRCVIDTYYGEVTFASGPWVPEVTPMRVTFPAVLAKGRSPMVPVTPIGFVSPER